MSQGDQPIQIRSPTLIFWILFAVLVGLAVFFVACAVVRGIAVLALGAIVPLLLASTAWYFATHPWLILKLTADGFYTRAHKLTVPWRFVFGINSMNEGMYPNENMLLSTMFLEVDGTGFSDHESLVAEMQRRSAAQQPETGT